MTCLIQTAPEYKLKYDQKDNQLRDLTSDELKRCYGRGNKILCPCSNKDYGLQAFITHTKSNKHQLWGNKEKIEHIKEYGHCCDAESMVMILRQQLREGKVMYANLSNAKLACDKKILVAERNITELMREVDFLKDWTK